MGGDLDSLSDVISFGVAPAVLGFTLGLRGGWDMLCLTYFIVCGVSRLARFNVTAAALSAGARQGEYLRGAPLPPSTLIGALLGGGLRPKPIYDALWPCAGDIVPSGLRPLTLC